MLQLLACQGLSNAGCVKRALRHAIIFNAPFGMSWQVTVYDTMLRPCPANAACAHGSIAVAARKIVIAFQHAVLAQQLHPGFGALAADQREAVQVGEQGANFLVQVGQEYCDRLGQVLPLFSVNTTWRRGQMNTPNPTAVPSCLICRLTAAGVLCSSRASALRPSRRQASGTNR